MVGMMNWYNTSVQIAREQEAISRVYNELRQRPIEEVQDYRRQLIDEWDGRSLLRKAFTFGRLPIGVIAADKVLDEQKLEERV